jgi:hypothetical protein
LRLLLLLWLLFVLPLRVLLWFLMLARLFLLPMSMLWLLLRQLLMWEMLWFWLLLLLQSCDLIRLLCLRLLFQMAISPNPGLPELTKPFLLRPRLHWRRVLGTTWH